MHFIPPGRGVRWNSPLFLDTRVGGMTYFEPVIGEAIDRQSSGPGRASLAHHPILLIWAAWSVALLLIGLPSILYFHTQDPDDFLRLLEVRDLLAGQSWFDVTQYRMNPPAGAAMHWSRLVDVPIAAALLVTQSLVAEPLASKLAMTIVPLSQLLLVMGLVWRLLAELGADRRHRLVAIAIVPLFPLVVSCFAPMRIDHHGWQAIAALGCALCFVRAPHPRSALIGGIVAALWLSVSLEGLPLVVVFAGLYALRFLLFGERGLAWFLTGLAGMSVVAHLATRPASEMLPHCDSVGWPHLAAFGAAALLAQAGAGRRGGGADVAIRSVRLAMLLAIGGVAGALIVAPIGVCAVNPFATIDPVMELYWHGVIFEGLPITKQLPSMRLELVWTPLILLAAIATGLPGRSEPLAERRWLWLALLVAAAVPIGMLVMREGINVELLALPFSTLLVVRYLPIVRAVRRTLPRALATAALPLVATPTLASAGGKPLDHLLAADARARLPVFPSATSPTEADCDLASLSSLPASHVFATLDVGPEILVKTPHTVVVSGYHRNMGKMREVVEAFSGDPAHAASIVRANHARYLTLCLHGGDTAVFRSRRTDNLANALVVNRVPTWLDPVAPFSRGELRVYRVR